MFVITADQRNSRRHTDRVADAITAITDSHSHALLRPPERTAGDEFQLALDDAESTVTVALQLSRDGDWSVGIGIGPIVSPLPTSIRAGSGEAFIAARDAVTAAKKSTLRCAIRGGTAHASITAEDAQTVMELLVALRDRRGASGWEAIDLIESGASQKDTAARLGVSESAISQRLRTAHSTTENSGKRTLATLLRVLNTPEGEEA